MEVTNILELEKKLEKCKEVNIEEIDINELDEISSIQVDTEKSSVERILDFLVKSKNPYAFRHGEYKVKIEFSNSSIYAENCVTNVFKNIYK